MMKEFPLAASVVEMPPLPATARMLLHHDGYIGDEEFEMEGVGDTTEEKLK